MRLFFFLMGLGLPRPFFALFALISTGVCCLFVIPMEVWFVMARAVNLQAGVDYFVGDGPVEFDNFHPLSVTQSAGGFPKGFDYRDRVALP
jgi:hypothetical protein